MFGEESKGREGEPLAPRRRVGEETLRGEMGTWGHWQAEDEAGRVHRVVGCELEEEGW